MSAFGYPSFLCGLGPKPQKRFQVFFANLIKLIEAIFRNILTGGICFLAINLLGFAAKQSLCVIVVYISQQIILQIDRSYDTSFIVRDKDFFCLQKASYQTVPVYTIACTIQVTSKNDALAVTPEIGLPQLNILGKVEEHFCTRCQIKTDIGITFHKLRKAVVIV